MSGKIDTEYISNELTLIAAKLKGLQAQRDAQEKIYREETHKLTGKARDLVISKLYPDMLEKDPLVWALWDYCTHDSYRRRLIGEEPCDCDSCFETIESIYETETDANDAKTKKQLTYKEDCYVNSLRLREAERLGGEGGVLYDLLLRKYGLPNL
jgi:hypothetical protein